MKPKLLTVFVLLACLGCGGPPIRLTRQIQAVFYHEDGYYSVMWIDANHEVQTLSFRETRGNGNRVRLWADVAPTEPMRVDYDADRRWDGQLRETVDIHIRSVDDLRGGAWNHGKFGHGQTERVAP